MNFCNNLLSTILVFAAIIIILMLGFKWNRFYNFIFNPYFKILNFKKIFLLVKYYHRDDRTKKSPNRRKGKLKICFRWSILKYFIFFSRKKKSLQVQLANIRPVCKAFVPDRPGSLPKFYREVAKALKIDQGCILFVSKDKIDYFLFNFKKFLIKWQNF